MGRASRSDKIQCEDDEGDHHQIEGIDRLSIVTFSNAADKRW